MERSLHLNCSTTFARWKIYDSCVHGFICGWYKYLHKLKCAPLQENSELLCFEVWILTSGLMQQLVLCQRDNKKHVLFTLDQKPDDQKKYTDWFLPVNHPVVDNSLIACCVLHAVFLCQCHESEIRLWKKYFSKMIFNVFSLVVLFYFCVESLCSGKSMKCYCFKITESKQYCGYGGKVWKWLWETSFKLYFESTSDGEYSSVLSSWTSFCSLYIICIILCQ